ISEPYGMVLVTGPTGSGKTTTLYAAVNEIKTDEDKIITIEDPVEYQIRGITQIPVNEKKGLTFARGLRSILRHDPDKIMVGEIRDTETAQIAINSALTGHLVFTTVHANNVVDVLGRFLNMGVEAYNFVSALNCILAQRLVRTICDYCGRAVRYDEDTLLTSGLDPAEWRDFEFREGQGCMECGGTGYGGRGFGGGSTCRFPSRRRRRAGARVCRAAAWRAESWYRRGEPGGGRRRRGGTAFGYREGFAAQPFGHPCPAGSGGTRVRAGL